MGGEAETRAAARRFGGEVTLGRIGLEGAEDEARVDLSCDTMTPEERLGASQPRPQPSDRGEAAESIPEQVGRFRILRELGRGGCGVVYLAHDPKLQRRVALKLPRAEMLLTPNARKRFLREAQATATLDHPHITPAFETGEAAGVCYLVTPYCSGGALSEYLATRSEPLPIRQAAQMAALLADAVHYAHSRGVLHRDIKPANVLLEAQRDSDSQAPADLPFVPRLTDFGLARFLDPDEAERDGPPHEGFGGPVSLSTGSGALLGTPHYMAPEQINSQIGAIGPATDVYGLGALLYELLTGRPPFSGSSKIDALRRVLSDDPSPPRRARPEAPSDLEAICLQCLQKQPERRYATAADLKADLQRFLAGEPTLARPLTIPQRTARWLKRRPALAGLMATVALAIVGWIVGLSAHSAQLGLYARALEDSLARESQQKEEANRQRRRAEERELDAQRHAYVSETWRAWRMWSEGSGHRICELLQGSAPQAGQQDLRGFEWRYLWGLGCNLADLRGHLRSVHGVCFSPDGQACASWSYDAPDPTIRLWHVPSRSLRRTLRPPAAPYAVTFAADGRQLLCVDEQGRLSRFDAATGRRMASPAAPELKAPPPRIPQVHTFSPDGRLLAHPAWISEDRRGAQVALRIWDLQTNEVRTILGPTRSQITALAFSADASLVAAGLLADGERGEALVFRVDTGQCVQSFSEEGSSFPSLAFSPEGRTLAAGTRPGAGKIRLWDLDSGQSQTLDLGGTATSVCVEFSPDGALLASGRDDAPGAEALGRLQIWETRSGALKAGPSTSGERVWRLRFSPDGKALAFAGGNGLLRLWSVRPQEELERIEAHAKEAWSVAFSPDNSLLASTSDDHTVRIWDARTRELKATLRGHESLVCSAVFAPDGRTLATSSFDGTIKLWDVAAAAERRTLLGHQAPIRSLAFHRQGRLLASASDDQTVKLWDPGAGELRATLPGHTNKVRAVVFEPQSDLLVSADNDGFVKLWDARRKTLLHSWREASEIQALAISSDGRLLAAGSKEGFVRMYQMPTGRLLFVLPGPTNGARALAFSADDLTLACGGEDQAVTLWHVATGQELLAMPGVSAQVNSLAFSRDGRMLAAATHEGIVTLWRAQGEE